MLFFRANEETCVNIMQILKDFGKILGQQLNYKKTYVKFSPLQKVKMTLKEILTMGEVKKLGNHLGIPIDLGRKKKGDFQFIIDKVHEKILAWSSFRLPQPVKVVLIQSVLLSNASHVMRCLKLLAYVTNKIDSLVARFFWANKGEKGMH